MILLAKKKSDDKYPKPSNYSKNKVYRHIILKCHIIIAGLVLRFRKKKYLWHEISLQS